MLAYTAITLGGKIIFYKRSISSNPISSMVLAAIALPPVTPLSIPEIFTVLDPVPPRDEAVAISLLPVFESVYNSGIVVSA